MVTSVSWSKFSRSVRSKYHSKILQRDGAGFSVFAIATRQYYEFPIPVVMVSIW